MAEITAQAGVLTASTRRLAAGRGGGTRWVRRTLATPTILVTIALGAYPLVFLVAAAVTESSLGRPFQELVGADQLVAAATSENVLASIVRGTGYALGVALASTVLGTATAFALWRSALSGSLARILVLLPLALPPVVVGVLWRLILTPNGGLVDTVRAAVAPGSSPIAILSDPGLALVGIGLADVWEWTPLITILVLAGLLGIDREVLEAASLDGAHGLRLLREIALPAIAGTIAAVFVIRLVLAFKVFDLIAVMTSGGPGQATTTPSWLVWQATIDQFDVGRGASITLLLAVVVTVITLPPILIARRRHD